MQKCQKMKRNIKFGQRKLLNFTKFVECNIINGSFIQNVLANKTNGEIKF